MLGDILIAEKDATIGFAGSRVIEETIKEKLPKNFQKSEYLLEKGMIDIVSHRKIDKISQEIDDAHQFADDSKFPTLQEYNAAFQGT